MKRFFSLLLAAVLIVSMVGVITALAGLNSVTISGGTSSPKAGKSYDYTVTVEAYGFNFVSIVSCSGVFSGASVDCDASRSSNGTLSKSATIHVSVASSAQPGDKGYITVKGSGCSVDESYNPVDEFSISKTFTYTVPDPSLSTPRPATSATATPEPTGWALAAIEVPAIEQGGAYDIEVTDDTTVPAEVLLSLREKQGVLNVNFGTYTCTIDGAALGTIPEDLTGINLAMSLDTDETLSQSLGGADVYQLHFSHEGALPGKFTYRFPAMANQPGDIVYLYYYYDASGVVEAKQECVVDDEGYITVSIYHCSSYFISATLIEGAAGIIAQPEAEPEPTVEAEPTQAPVATPQAEVSKPVEVTDDSGNLTVSAASPIEQWFGVPYAPLIAALAAAVLLSMLLTMLFTRSGLFKRRPKAAATAEFFAPDVEDIPPSDDVEDLPPTDDAEDTPTDDKE